MASSTTSRKSSTISTTSNRPSANESKLSVEKIGDQLMEEVKRTYSSSKKVSDELMSLLNFTFQGPLLSALELVEKRSVTCVLSPSGRQLFQIVGASGTPYTCFPNQKYCSCPAYHFSVLCKGDHIMEGDNLLKMENKNTIQAIKCKHVLAIKLSEAMALTKILQVSDAEITNMIMAME